MDQLMGLYGQFINDYYSNTTCARLLGYTLAAFLVSKTAKNIVDMIRNK